jgi:hypothetical protein
VRLVDIDPRVADVPEPLPMILGEAVAQQGSPSCGSSTLPATN